jgi:hypothetical protein
MKNLMAVLSRSFSRLPVALRVLTGCEPAHESLGGLKYMCHSVILTSAIFSLSCSLYF